MTTSVTSSPQHSTVNPPPPLNLTPVSSNPTPLAWPPLPICSPPPLMLASLTKPLLAITKPIGSEAVSSALRAHNDLRAHTRLIRDHFGLGRSDQRSHLSGTVWSEAISSATSTWEPLAICSRATRPMLVAWRYILYGPI